MSELSNKRENKIIYSYNRSDVFSTLLLVAASLLYRPMLLGNEYSLFGAMLFIAAMLFVILKQNGKVILRKNAHTRTYICAIILFVYCAIQCVLVGSDRINEGLVTSVLLVLAVTAFYLCFLNKAIQTLFIRFVMYAMMLFSISYVISVVLMFLVGWDSIKITSLDYGYFTTSGIYLPFTTTYGQMPLNGIIFKRLLGFARESGIMQIFYVWGFFSAEKYFSRTKIVQVLMLIGIVACFSTSGFIVFGVSLLVYFDVRSLFKKGGFKKMLVIIALTAAMVYLLFYAQGTRILSRATATISDRMAGINFGLSVFREHPLFGGGFYNTFGYPNIQTGVCAIASLGQVGLVGVGLWLFVFLFAFLDCSNKKRFLFTNAAMFITAIFAQPIMFAPVMYWFLFCDYDDNRVKLMRKIKKWR